MYVLQLLNVAPLYLNGKMQSFPLTPLHPELAALSLAGEAGCSKYFLEQNLKSFQADGLVGLCFVISMHSFCVGE